MLSRPAQTLDGLEAAVNGVGGRTSNKAPLVKYQHPQPAAMIYELWISGGTRDGEYS